MTKNRVLVDLNLRELQHIGKVLDRELKEVKRLGMFSKKEVVDREKLLMKIYKATGDVFDELYEGK